MKNWNDRVRTICNRKDVLSELLGYLGQINKIIGQFLNEENPSPITVTQIEILSLLNEAHCYFIELMETILISSNLKL